MVNDLLVILGRRGDADRPPRQERKGTRDAAKKSHAYIASQLSLISIGVTVMNGFPVTAHSILVLAWVFTVGCPS